MLHPDPILAIYHIPTDRIWLRGYTKAYLELNIQRWTIELKDLDVVEEEFLIIELPTSNTQDWS